MSARVESTRLSLPSSQHDSLDRSADDWIDPAALVESSRVESSRWRALLVLLPPLGLLAMLAAAATLLLSPAAGPWPAALSLVLLIASLAATLALAGLARAATRERQAVGKADELATLRRFPEATSLLIGVLNQPMRVPQTRLLALAHLSRVLGRYGRFDEAAEVAESVLADPSADPATRFAVGCGRAMALLRAERLADANDAVSGLRRDVTRLDDALRKAAEEDESVDADERPKFDSAALTLVEMYRDVHTRHDAEALEIFDAKRAGLRDALGPRLADALALAATAALRLRYERAAGLWSDATCLAPATELVRRYPEVAEVAARHPASEAPAAVEPEPDGHFVPRLNDKILGLAVARSARSDSEHATDAPASGGES